MAYSPIKTPGAGLGMRPVAAGLFRSLVRASAKVGSKPKVLGAKPALGLPFNRTGFGKSQRPKFGALVGGLGRNNLGKF